MCAVGHKPASSVRSPKCNNIQLCHLVYLLFLMHTLIIYTLTLSEHFQYQKVTPIYLPVLIGLMTAQTVIQAFISGWILCFGVQSTITTDRGHQFESVLWQQLMQLLGCKQIHTSSYHHPMANSMVERFHCQ